MHGTVRGSKVRNRSERERERIVQKVNKKSRNRKERFEEVKKKKKIQVWKKKEEMK